MKNLPHYEEWLAQYYFPQGDHSDTAKDFLLAMLPFLALGALQDGIYWICDHPNNSTSIMLQIFSLNMNNGQLRQGSKLNPSKQPWKSHT